MIELTKLIEAQALTQAAAAKLLGVTQRRISDLVRGKIDRFSVDALIEMLGHAGVSVAFVVTPRRPQGGIAGWKLTGDGRAERGEALDDFSLSIDAILG